MSKQKSLNRIMRPLIKYPGGKEKEIKIIAPRLPRNIENYYEPFFGGGAVFFALMPGKKKFINDISCDLANFYTCIKLQNEDFFKELIHWNDLWKQASLEAQGNLPHLIELFENGEDPDLVDDEVNEIVNSKFVHIRKKAVETGSVSAFSDNIEASFKQALFVKARKAYNQRQDYDGVKAALFVLMRQYGFSGMFRYNAAGEFNIPYGGVAYNDKYLDERIRLMRSDIVIDAFEKTTIGNADFYSFMREYPPRKDDFVFVDPPYDTEFSSYDNNCFGREDQQRLSDYLINECEGNWMLVIKATDFIRSLYPEESTCANGGQVFIFEFDKKYDVCIRGRNNQNCEHLVITNYKTMIEEQIDQHIVEDENGEAQ